MSKLKDIIKIAFERTTVISSLQVALIVGIIINAINQWSVLSTMDYHLLNPPKMILTFLVPYLVSAYATIKAKI